MLSTLACICAIIMILWLYNIIIVGMTLEFLVSATVLTALLLLVRFCFRGRIRASVINSLWILIVLRLLLCAIFSFAGENGAPAGKWNVSRITNSVMRVVTPEDDKEEEGRIEPVVFDIGAISLPLWTRVVWLGGCIVFVAVFIFLNERFRRRVYRTRIRLRLPDEEYPVYQVPHIFSPFVFRIRRERAVYLTEDIARDEEKRKYVIAHEACHIQHHDLFWALVRNMVLACFWFHPIIWIAAIASKRDSETACDERAVRKLGGRSERQNYGKVLLDMVDEQNRKEDIFYLATTMTAGKKELYQRIKLLTEEKKERFITAACIPLICLVLFVTCFTSGAKINGLNEEETIRQYLYYDSQQYRRGMLQLYPDTYLSYHWVNDALQWKYYGVRAQKILSIQREKAETAVDTDEWVTEEDVSYTELFWYRVDLIRACEVWDYNKSDFVIKNLPRTDYVLLGKAETEDDWRIVYWMDEEEREVD